MNKLKPFLKFKRNLIHLILALILVVGLGVVFGKIGSNEQNMSLLSKLDLVKVVYADHCSEDPEDYSCHEPDPAPGPGCTPDYCSNDSYLICAGTYYRPDGCGNDCYGIADCSAPPPPECNPDCSASGSVCAGVTFPNGCGGSCSGSLDCSGGTPGEGVPPADPLCPDPAPYCDINTGTTIRPGGGAWNGVECIYNYEDTQQSCTGGGNEGDWCPIQPPCSEGEAAQGTINGIIQNGVCIINNNTSFYTCQPVSTGGQCPADETYCDGSTQIHKHGGYYDPNSPSADSAGCVYAYDSQGSCGETTQCTADETYCDNGTQIRKHGGYYDPNSPLADSSGCVFAFDATGQSCGSSGLGYGFCDNGVTKQCNFFCEGNLRYHDSPTGKQLESTCAQGEVCRGGPPEDPGGCFPGQGGTQATARPSPSSGTRPPGGAPPPPGGGIPIATLRPGATLAPGATLRPGATLAPGSTASPRATASPGAGAVFTTHFRVAERIEDLDNTPYLPYTREPMPFTFTFSNTTPGTKNVYVEFKDSNNRTEVNTKSIELISPDPELSSISCNLDIAPGETQIGDTPVDIIFKITGNNFGPATAKGTVKAGTTNLTITDWQDKQVIGKISVPANTTSGTNYLVTLTLPDNRKVENSCTIGLSQLSLGAKLFCPQIADRDIKDVKVGLFEASTGGKVKRVTSAINTKFALIENLKQTLQKGVKYQACVDTPQTTRSCSEPFVGAEGTTILNMDPLRFGDIAGQGPGCPGEGEGVINSIDKACLNQQWGPNVSSAKKNCDCNNDGVCNSFEWSYMRNFFDKRDDPEPKF